MRVSIVMKCDDDYITPLTYFVNLLITKETFPNELKLAKVIFIVKFGNEQHINSNCPISVLTFFF